MQIVSANEAGCTQRKPHTSSLAAGWLPAAIEIIGQAALLASVTVSAWFFGGVQAIAQAWLCLTIAAALACALLAVLLRGRAAGAPLPLATLPLLGLLGIGLLQLAPIPSPVAGALSPHSTTLAQQLGKSEGLNNDHLAAAAEGGSNDHESAGLPASRISHLASRLPPPASRISPPASRLPHLASRIPHPASRISPPASRLSLYPARTRDQLSIYALGVAAFVAAAVLFRTRAAQTWLAAVVALNGAAVAFFGLVQYLTWNGMLFWTVPLRFGGGPFGPFVNRNHAGCYLNLCLGGAVAWLISVLLHPSRATPQSALPLGFIAFPARPSPLQQPSRPTAAATASRTLTDVAGSRRQATESLGMTNRERSASQPHAADDQSVVIRGQTYLQGKKTAQGSAHGGVANLRTAFTPAADGQEKRAPGGPSRRRATPHALALRAWDWLSLNVFWHIDAATLTVLVTIGFIMAGVLCSLSRGAAVSLAAGVVLTSAFVYAARRKTLPLWFAAMLVMGTVFLVAWVGMQHDVLDRIATLYDLESASEGRVAHWQDTFRAFPDFWPLGSGFGTYGYVYQMYQRHLCEGWFDHAHNQYLEWLIEGGVAFMLLLAAAAGLVVASAWRLLRRSPEAAALAVAVPAVLAVATQSIHAVGEFGLSVPANLLLLAALCGPCGTRIAGSASFQSEKKATVRFLASVLILALLLALSLRSFSPLRAASAAERALRQAAEGETPKANLADIEQSIRRLEEASTGRPDNAELHLRIAESLITACRLRSLGNLRGKLDKKMPEDQMWALTSPTVIHANSHQLHRTGQHAALEALRKAPLTVEYLLPAIERLRAARAACPLLPRVHFRLAQLAGLAEPPDRDARDVDRLRLLAPSDPDDQFRCGLLDFQAGRAEKAYASWRRCLGLSDKYLDRLLSMSGHRFTLWDAADKVFPESPAQLVAVARRSSEQGVSENLRELLLAKAERLLKLDEQPGRRTLPADQAHHLLGTIYFLRREYAAAVIQLDAAVQLSPHELEYRYDLARALQGVRNLRGAREQALWCVRMSPHNAKYKALLDELREAGLTGKL